MTLAKPAPEPRKYDLILADGSYLAGQIIEADVLNAARVNGRVEFVLEIGRRHRMPFLGKLLRFRWAKRRGALLH